MLHPPVGVEALRRVLRELIERARLASTDDGARGHARGWERTLAFLWAAEDELDHLAHPPPPPEPPTRG